MTSRIHKLMAVVLCSALPALADEAQDVKEKEKAAATAVKAEPVDPALRPAVGVEARAKQLRATVKSFRLDLWYSGKYDKPYRHLTVAVPAIERSKTPANQLDVQITEAAALKIIDHLALDGFLERADDGNRNASHGEAGPCYSLAVGFETAPGKLYRFTENLGWGAGMVARLQALRKVLDGAAAKQMDQVLEVLK